jgi:hypothetical protein
MQGRLVKQVPTDFFEDGLRQQRYELAAGLRLKGGITPTIKYVSPIFKNDNRGQIYLDALFLDYFF